MSKKPDHYETLGVPRDATEAQIKSAYRKRAKAEHPDREGGDADEMKKINEAYACLGDPERRAIYDETGEDGSGHTVQEVGQELLTEAFDRVMNNGVESNFLAAVRNTITQQITRLNAQAAQMRQAERMLKKVRNKVRRKREGINSYQILVDHRLQVLAAGAEEAVRKCDEFNAALRLLDEYEEDDVMPTYESIYDRMTKQITGG